MLKYLALGSIALVASLAASLAACIVVALCDDDQG